LHDRAFAADAVKLAGSIGQEDVMMSAWWALAIAIVSEVIATSFLRQSEGFSRLWPSLVVVLGYGSAFYFMSLTLKTIPMGVTYAVWSGAGIVLIALVGWLAMGQTLDRAALLGMGLIVAGVLVIQLGSNSVGHG
jgi:small multidrug resistance pump